MSSDQHSVPPESTSTHGAITDVAGIEVGHFTDARRPTGCTVIITRDGAVAGVDVRGAAPGTRETDLLHPSNLIDRVHAIVLSGGSAWGLDAASRSSPAQGNVGVGAGALVGKLFGLQRAMRGGIGTASVTVNGITVGAPIACNAMGDVINPTTGDVLAGARTPDGASLLNSRDAILAGVVPQSLLAGTNTTIGVIATDAILTKPQVHRLAQVAHDGLARSINPAHTLLDGDTLFALGTGRSGKSADMLVLCTLAAEVTAQAVVQAIRAAKGITIGAMTWPAACDLSQPSTP